jgi:hypothetical protein
MPSLIKFNCFTKDLAEKKHNLSTDQLTVALTNVQPSTSYSQISEITEINYTGLSSRNLVTVSSAQVEGTYKLVENSLTISATGVNSPIFRYVVVYNSTVSGGPLLGYFDIGYGVVIYNNGGFFPSSGFTIGLSLIDGFIIIQ